MNSVSGIRNFSTCMRRYANLQGKTAIVTASTEGIGFAIAHKLGKDGANVVISSRKEEKVSEALSKLKSDNISAIGIPCHVGKSEDRKSLLDLAQSNFGAIDILVTNAGVNPYFGTTLQTPEKAYDKIFDTNVKSTFQWIQDAVPLMEKSPNASITIVSSIGAFAPFEMLGIYSVSKTALVGLTKALSPELGAKNIRINCIAPGIIKTKFSQALWKNPDISKTITSQVALKRVGTADECGGIVSFLSSDEATYVTGETFVVSGGMPSRL
uniref:Dehydrogenase/reductase SDR family member 4-like n=1 Tax=Phallusia mammillata TaxID=59560 RepID=A0A6F9DBH8_9ASCI|nr:dehydrogenase/reductase SDR family member 4-like [Phallusia mammillata]